jgi:hypothetical protein
MSDCGQLSDRMPQVALERAEWSADEARHLRDCRSCQEEWELVRAAGRLGAGVGSGLDGGSLTRGVLERLKQTRAARRRRRAWSFVGLAAAAAVAAILLGDGTLTRTAGSPSATNVARLEIPLPELEGLQPAELDSVLQTMDEPIAGSTLDAPDLGDLDSDQLERVLETWEG